MFELQSCRITRREERGDASNMFTAHIAYYESTFVDENNDEYVYTGEFIYVNKVPSLLDCINDTISDFYNHDTVHKKRLNCMQISNLIGDRIFDLYINGTFYRRHLDLNDLNCLCSILKSNGFFVYDVTRSLTAPSEYNLLVEKESKTC